MSAEQTVLGAGAAQALGAVLDQLEAASVLLVTGERSYTLSGAAAAVAPALAGRTVTRFSDFEANPKVEDAARGARLARQSRPDVIVAVGGGSVIDMGKLIAAFAVANDPLVDIATGRRPVPEDSLPVVAIPTTAGTGSEATHFAVVYVGEQKFSVAHPGLLPVRALVDPALTHSLPPRLTAQTGFDALAQAMESLWATGATPHSRKLAAEALEAALTHLPDAVNAPSGAAREGMSRASWLAGRAIDITRTTAPHALSYKMTSGWGVPHGHAVALTLGPVLEYNAESDRADTREAMARILTLLGVSSPGAGRRRVEALMAQVGLETRLSALGMTTASDRRALVESVNLQRLSNNPRPLDADQLAALLDSIA